MLAAGFLNKLSCRRELIGGNNFAGIHHNVKIILLSGEIIEHEKLFYGLCYAIRDLSPCRQRRTAMMEGEGTPMPQSGTPIPIPAPFLSCSRGSGARGHPAPGFSRGSISDTSHLPGVPGLIVWCRVPAFGLCYWRGICMSVQVGDQGILWPAAGWSKATKWRHPW